MNKSKSSKAGKSKSLLNPMVALATLSSLMRANANHFTRQATIDQLKKKRQSAQYKKNSYLEEAIKNMNSALNSNKPVQSAKKILNKHRDIKRKSHPFHHGMPSENKHVYITKREELLRKLAVAKHKRITNKLSRKNLNPSKRSKLNERLQRMSRGHKGL
jgi:tRNA G18 (ribose-2'-O)-methylase SpoU